jgi:hypothetical protein
MDRSSIGKRRDFQSHKESSILSRSKFFDSGTLMVRTSSWTTLVKPLSSLLLR